MSSAQSLREFIRERLTAAAAEIFSEFEQTIVRYEEEIDRQRRLLEISWKPQINLHRIELPLHDVRTDEEVQTDQQLWNQERTSNLDHEQPEPLQEGPEPPHIKVEQEQPEHLQEGPEPPQMKVDQDDPEPLQVLEQEELCISQDEEQFVLKQETITSLVTPADEDRDHHEPEPDRHQLLLSLFPEAEIRATAAPESTELPHVCEKEKALIDQQLSNQETTSSSNQKEPDPLLMIREKQQELCIHQYEVPFILNHENVTFMVTSHSAETDCHEPEPNQNQPLCQCSTEAEDQGQSGCRIENSKSNEELTQNKRRQKAKYHREGQKMKRHKRAHRDKRTFTCEICGKCFSRNWFLTIHMRTHTGEKPYSCESCGKCFTVSSTLTKHMRTHTGEKPYSCGTCGKCFTLSGNLTTHMRAHTGERPYPCETCGKCFSQRATLSKHIRTQHK